MQIQNTKNCNRPIYLHCLQQILSVNDMLLLFLLVLIALNTWAEEFSIPTSIADVNGAQVPTVFVFDSDDQLIEDVIFQLCDKYSLTQTFCYVLFEEALYQQVIRRPDAFTDELVEKKYKKIHKFLPDVEKSPIKVSNMIDVIKLAESSVLAQIVAASDLKTIPPGRFVFVHSCSLPGKPIDILRKLLDALLLSQLTVGGGGFVVVLNYGDPVPQEVQDLSIRLFLNAIVFIQVSDVTTLYELPSLRLIKLFAQQLVPSGLSEAQMLYIHTKGVSYNEVPITIEHWTDLMMHFLVKRQESCYHLLLSGEFDAVGVNYQSTKDSAPHFSGNFWWATARYLDSLPLIEYSSIKHNNKHSAEYWLLYPYRELNDDGSHKIVPLPKRIHSMHDSGVNHYQVPYSGEMYLRNI